MLKGSCKKITSIGGQALIEGILMRGPQKTSISIRLPNGYIHTEYLEAEFIKDKYSIFKLPILRGLATFIDSMKIGYRALSLSAEKSGFAEEDNLSKPSKFDKWLEKTFGNKLMKFIMFLSSIIGIVLSILLFFILPTWLFNLITYNFNHINNINFYRSVFEGVIRIILFLIYVILCSQPKDIKRVFQYHGAEHKTIFCYENNEELIIENVKKYSRFHPRCGTSFIFLMLIIGIIVGLFIPFSNPFLRSFIKILCIPIIVGCGYEIIKFCGCHNNLFTRIIAAPGLWIQRITTKEPDDDMIEVAIESIKAVIPENGEDIIKV